MAATWTIAASAPARPSGFRSPCHGALFFLGDCHAVQGDGEIVGTGIETSYEVEVRLTVEKGKKLVWPRGENADDIFSVGNARPLDQALQHATTDMFNWLIGRLWAVARPPPAT